MVFNFKHLIAENKKRRKKSENKRDRQGGHAKEERGRGKEGREKGKKATAPIAPEESKGEKETGPARE